MADEPGRRAHPRRQDRRRHAHGGITSGSGTREAKGDSVGDHVMQMHGLLTLGSEFAGMGSDSTETGIDLAMPAGDHGPEDSTPPDPGFG